MRKKIKTKSRAGKVKRRTRPYPYEFRIKMVQLYLEEGYSTTVLREQFGVSSHSVQRWVKAYREQGSQGLIAKPPTGTKAKLPKAVKHRIVGMKKKHPEYGPRRIADVLKRFFLVPVSPSSVHKTLSDEGLTKKAKVKAEKNPTKPQFFERSRPNQLWQSDIMTFRLAGRNAYLIGYLDDYSRYITSLGLFRSQTAAHVLETYRRGISEYGVPREMLTDNGRQYTNWRGKTRFEREMKKDRVKHIKSRPHHPMTLGKIERFWKSIQNEFLFRVQFDSFEQAVERTAYWIKYYNYKRPHQGIGGLCPADRFFEIQHDLKRTLQKGVEENALELALRGRPLDPFYMVGRMGGQSVVIRAEKGKVKMLVDGQDQQVQKELVYDARKDIKDEGTQAYPQDIRLGAENYGRAVDLDRAAHISADLPGAGHQCELAWPVAEPGHRGDAQSSGSDEKGSSAAAQPPALTANRKEAERFRQKNARAAQGDPEDEISQHNVARDGFDEKTSYDTAGGPTASRGDHESSLRADERQPGSRAVRDLPQELLQVGTTCPQCDVGGAYGSTPWSAIPACGHKEAGAGRAAATGPPGQRTAKAQNGTKGCTDGVETGTRHGPGGKKMSVSKRHWP
ncbi:MAG: IS481 family transposase [Desulfobacterales bacterium]